MKEALKNLRLDHANFMKLLSILEQELAVFDSGDRPDYEIIETISAYFADYAETFHHPLENSIYTKLRERDPKAAEAMGDLEREHEATAKDVAAFAEAAQAVLQEAEIPRSLFHERAMTFIRNERAHIGMEERLFFPQAEAALTDADWQAIDKAWTGAADPLFSDSKKAEYQDLARRIADWENEAQQRRIGSLA